MAITLEQNFALQLLYNYSDVSDSGFGSFSSLVGDRIFFRSLESV